MFLIPSREEYVDAISYLHAVIKPNIETGPWLAGGFPLSLVAGIPIGASDIDVWCANKTQIEEVCDRLRSNGCRLESITEHAKSFVLYANMSIGNERRSKWNLQVILHEYASHSEVINSFDIDVCRVITDLKNVYVEDRVLDSIKSRTFNLTYIGKGSLHRFCKYVWKGFTPTQKSIDLLHKHADAHQWKVRSANYMF